MKIYVAMHKKIDLGFKSDLYEPLLVGSYNKKDKDILRDDKGENISSKNENYCELTGVYWIWKNSKEDIVGLCHYRRFLSKRFFSSKSKYYLTEEEINELFNKGYDMILPKKHLYLKSIQNSLNIAPNVADMEVVKDSIKKLYPEYMEAYDKYMNGNSSYLCNVMITKKEIFDEYSEWLFKILYDVEENMDKETYIHDSYRKRMFGFLSERLLNVWIIHNKNKFNIKEYYLINTQEKFIQKFKYYIKQVILKIMKKNK